MKNHKEIEVQDDPEILSIKCIKQRINTIQRVLKDVMIEGVHYGKVPGCGDKPALLQPGAEIIMTTFRIAPDPQIIDLSVPGRIHYRIVCRGLSVSGQFLGAGIGEGSSDEEKYAWRAALSDEEYDATPETDKRIKFKRYWNKNTRTYKFEQVKQIRTNPADVGNTVLKMTYKRALVSMVRTTTACSDVFAQDIDESVDVIGEDVPEQPNAKTKEPVAGDVNLDDVMGSAGKSESVTVDPPPPVKKIEPGDLKILIAKGVAMVKAEKIKRVEWSKIFATLEGFSTDEQKYDFLLTRLEVFEKRAKE